MKRTIDRSHPLYALFLESVSLSVQEHVHSKGLDDTSTYLADLLALGVRSDSVFALRGTGSQPLTTVTEMLEEGDIRLRATSFEQERQVHQYIGDYILFWTGINPMYLRHIKLKNGIDLVCDYRFQAQESYGLVSSYEAQKQSGTAVTFEKLRDGFDDYAFCLRVVRERLGLMPWIEA